jgi:dTMP kinase
MKILNNFVVFEGGDGSGTSTQMEKLKKSFATPQGLGVRPLRLFSTFEPSDGPIGRLIRSGLRGEISLKSETIAFLFAADRNEHVFGPGGIVEHTKQGDLVVCDRYILSSLVYQGITCGEELPLRLNSHFPLPEALLFFDVDPEIAQKRMENRQEKEIYEALEFQIQVRGRYKTLLPYFEAEGCRVEIIDASLPPDEVAHNVWGTLRKMPIFKG